MHTRSIPSLCMISGLEGLYLTIDGYIRVLGDGHTLSPIRVKENPRC